MMLRFERWINRLCGRGEKGQAMVMALIALTLGMLLITPVLSYMYTGVKAATVYKRVTGELYAADAGVEYAMWCINKGLTVNSPITVGGMPVTITSTPTQLLYGPEIVQNNLPQSARLTVSRTIVSNGNGTSTYTITVTNGGGSEIHLTQTGARLPVGFTYVTGSTSGNVTTGNPDSINGNNISWTLQPPPKLDPGTSEQLIFRIQGTGTPIGYYAWVITGVGSIGTVYSGCWAYSIVAQANGGTTIRANVAQIQTGGNIFPISWKVN